ncbi:septum formation family protein [Saccharothrix coeruleofusca]|uniref:Septum formation-related domain-containing protein n=1 Tax=Saccharothrix coeruleofusca TaxID=33919 RepID=A0A918AHU2_9PSEU|nr:septum formation family protein [Saccharothrix coeruleofusca]MBP2339853.1 hypothetical protein [Saccharothrix coeruleofusca]GGP39172.1 hypothetical protein GCM10010185_08380 [Saccharothrix coeruleofusca]
MRRRALVAVVTALALASCTRYVEGSPDDEVRRPSITPSAQELPAPGQCVNAELRQVDCAGPHEAEVTDVGELGDVGEGSQRDVRRAAVPPCRAALARYVGSADHDATRLHAQAMWPSADGWARGDRWRLCLAVELAPDGQRVARSGSVKDLLKASGFASVQLCALDSPSQARDPKLTGCDTAHVAEAVPGVLSLGSPGDPAPSQEEVDARAREHCATAVRGYVGADRPDVFAAWRAFGSLAWSEGFTTAVCYAEATRPFTGRLWGLGANPLPG